MQKLSLFSGIVAPLDRPNVDTDQIIPKQFLKSIRRSGFGANLFDSWRYLDNAEPGRDNGDRPLNHGFVLNQPRYRGATILLARGNFGCGSSREHAVWALLDYGFRTIVAPSFGDIFFVNCFKNGLLPVRLREPEVNQLFFDVYRSEGFRLTVDLEREMVLEESSGQFYRFDIDPFRKRCLKNGLDDIGLTLEHADKIRRFECNRWLERPWLAAASPRRCASE